MRGEVKIIPHLCDESVYKMADELRTKYHIDISDSSIEYVFTDEMNEKGKTVLGKSRRETDLGKLFSKSDFIILISEPQWGDLSESQQRAVLDHELCHCAPKFNRDGDFVGWTMRPHDLEEFTCVLERHGTYTPDRRNFCIRVAKKVIE